MSKKFTKITMAKSNEVSLCPTFNSGANFVASPNQFSDSELGHITIDVLVSLLFCL